MEGGQRPEDSAPPGPASAVGRSLPRIEDAPSPPLAEAAR